MYEQRKKEDFIKSTKEQNTSPSLTTPGMVKSLKVQIDDARRGKALLVDKRYQYVLHKINYDWEDIEIDPEQDQEIDQEQDKEIDQEQDKEKEKDSVEK